MLQAAKSSVRNLMNLYPPIINRVEYKRRRLTRPNERSIEYSFVFRKLAEIYPNTVLDVGTGLTSLPQLIRNCGFLVTAIDNVRDYWTAGMVNRHYHVINDDITNTRLTEKFDVITCISVLEHIKKSDDAVRNMIGLLNPGGSLLLTCPYTENSYVPNVYDLPGSTYAKAAFVTQSYSRAELDSWVQQNDLEIVEQEYWHFWDGDHWTVGEEQIPPRRVSVEQKHQLTLLQLRKKKFES